MPPEASQHKATRWFPVLGLAPKPPAGCSCGAGERQHPAGPVWQLAGAAEAAVDVAALLLPQVLQKVDLKVCRHPARQSGHQKWVRPGTCTC